MFEWIKNFFNKHHDITLGGWLIDIWETDDDYILWAWTPDLAELLKDREKINRQPVYEYNQWAQYETRNYCTIYSAITELSFLFDREFTICEIKEIANKMIADWKLDPNNWAYLHDSIDYCRRWWNEKFTDRKVVSYRIDYSDKTLSDILLAWNARLTQLGYRTSPELYNEVQATWIASKKTYPKIWGHAVSRYGENIINNYKWKSQHNRFDFKYFDELVKNKIIFKFWYVFLKEIND